MLRCKLHQVLFRSSAVHYHASRAAQGAQNATKVAFDRPLAGKVGIIDRYQVVDEIDRPKIVRFYPIVMDLQVEIGVAGIDI
ncbi:MAG: hypothetical protein AAF250_08270 [Pseudomonadota bacterium]